MGTTTVQLSTDLRDQLTAISRQDFHGVSLGETVRLLVREHEINRTMERYEQLRADPTEWATYHAELALIDNAAGDGMPDASGEYPEYNR